MKTIYTQGVVEPEFGYFYGLWTTKDDVDEFDNPDTVHSVGNNDEEGLTLQRISYSKIALESCCRMFPTSQVRCQYDYLTGRDTGPIAWMFLCGDLVCDRNLATQLLTSGLVGLSVSRIELLSPRVTAKEWYHVAGISHPAIQQGHCEPGVYKCWKCGFEPVCKECGRRPPRCPSCDEIYDVRERDWQGPSDRRLVLAEEDLPTVVDLRLWDGADYFHGAMTYRMLQFLLSVHAHPFRAVPLAVNVHGASKEDLGRLERARSAIVVGM